MAADDPPDRRKVLSLTCGALGAAAGLAVGVPVLRLFLAPAGETTVTGPSTPLDLGPLDAFKVGVEPRKVEIIAPIVKDAWTAARNVVLGAAFIRRPAPDKIVALSAVCPHLGCAVGWDAAAKNFLCPCHDSRFEAEGPRMTGPAERGLDTLPVNVVDGRLQLTWVRYRMGGAKPEPV